MPMPRDQGSRAVWNVPHTARGPGRADAKHTAQICKRVQRKAPKKTWAGFAAASCRGFVPRRPLSNPHEQQQMGRGGGGALGAGRCMGTTGAPHDVFDSCASPAHFPTDMCDLSTPRRCRVRLAPYSLSHPAPMVLVLSAGPEESPADWHLVYVRFRALTACGMQPCAPALEGRSDGWLRACHRPWRASGWLLAWELGSSTHRRHLSCWDNAVPRRSCASACPTVSDL